MEFGHGATSAQDQAASEPAVEAGIDVYLIRHGRYADPALDGYRFVGRSDPELDDVGQAQALALQSEFAAFDRPLILASPLRRAHQTARLAFPGAEIRLEPLAMEIDFGELEGLDFVEALARFPAAMQRYPELDFTGVGGEDRQQLIARAKQVANKCRNLGENRAIIVVSHAYFLDAFCAVAENEPRRPYSRAFQHCVPVRMQIRT
jgi:glucosyl-3-phosphoglycerate phosphatase